MELEGSSPCSHEPAVPILNHINAVHTIPSFSFKVCFNTFLPSTPRSSNWSLHVSPPHFCRYSPCMPHAPPISSSFDLVTRMRVRNKKMLIMWFSHWQDYTVSGPGRRSLKTARCEAWSVGPCMTFRSACGEVSAVSVWLKVWGREDFGWRGVVSVIFAPPCLCERRFVLRFAFLFVSLLDISVQRMFKPLFCTRETNLDFHETSYRGVQLKCVRPLQYLLKPELP